MLEEKFGSDLVDIVAPILSEDNVDFDAQIGEFHDSILLLQDEMDNHEIFTLQNDCDFSYVSSGNDDDEREEEEVNELEQHHYGSCPRHDDPSK